MSKDVRFKNEEYAPGARFLLTSFNRDRTAFEEFFSEFTAAYEAEFETQIEVVEKMERDVVLSYEQGQATKSLYEKSDGMNKDLNVLSFWFGKAKLPTSLLTKVKNNLMKRNIEGACQQIEGVVQLVREHESKLVPFGMKVGYFKVLDSRNEELKVLNVRQNELMDKGKGVVSVNVAEYKKLYAFIQNICKAGKIVFDNTHKEDEYTIRQLVRRMRSGNDGKKE